MSECKYYQELISRMLDKDLTKRERAAVMEHLDSCSECAAMYEAFSMLSNTVSDNLGEPPEELARISWQTSAVPKLYAKTAGFRAR